MEMETDSASQHTPPRNPNEAFGPNGIVSRSTQRSEPRSVPSSEYRRLSSGARPMSGYQRRINQENQEMKQRSSTNTVPAIRQGGGSIFGAKTPVFTMNFGQTSKPELQSTNPKVAPSDTSPGLETRRESTSRPVPVPLTDKVDKMVSNQSQEPISQTESSIYRDNQEQQEPPPNIPSEVRLAKTEVKEDANDDLLGSDDRGGSPPSKKRRSNNNDFGLNVPTDEIDAHYLLQGNGLESKEPKVPVQSEKIAPHHHHQHVDITSNMGYYTGSSYPPPPSPAVNPYLMMPPYGGQIPQGMMIPPGGIPAGMTIQQPLYPQASDPEFMDNQNSRFQLMVDRLRPFGFVRDVLEKPFIILGKLGRGGSSQVYRVLGPGMTEYALKVVKKDPERPKLIEEYRKERDLLYALRDTNHVIKLVLFEERSDVFFFVLELGGLDLKRVLNSMKGQFINMNLVRVYWSEILLAVRDVHRKHIFHGDLKPENFVSVKGHLKIIDFGIAHQISDATTHVVLAQSMGTINYMPPESLDVAASIKSSNITSRRSDIWSLGCILYELVYLRSIFDCYKDDKSKVLAITHNTFRIDFSGRDVPLELKDIITSCLKPNPKERPTIDELLDHPFTKGEHLYTERGGYYSSSAVKQHSQAPGSALPNPSAAPGASVVSSSHSAQDARFTAPSDFTQKSRQAPYPFSGLGVSPHNLRKL